MRTLNRAVTSIYDDVLRPHGLRVGQLNLLVAIARMEPARPSDLCRFLRMEKSTLSRDVELMRRNGWLDVDDSGDKRARPLKVSADGQTLLKAVIPAWRQAQERVMALLGGEVISSVRHAADRLWKEGATKP
ncbi:MarR family winged helix-turn-helix transcriptional regulator [Isosphaeraceae bacterium EP7]